MPTVFYVNVFFVFFSFWIAFSKQFRPMSWTMFWCNLGASFLNLVAVIGSLIKHMS